MMEKIKLVKDDTGPQLLISLTNDSDGTPIDVSETLTVVYFKFREAGSTTVKSTILCGKLTGFVEDDGSITTTAPYDVAGFGGRVSVNFAADTLDTAGEFEGEIEIQFEGGMIQTVYEKMKFHVREDF